MKEIIKSLYIENIGWIYAKEDSPITAIEKNGEMALVKWYRKENKEWNGKYVVQIEYE